MKKLFFTGIVLAFVAWLGCSSSEEEAGPTGPTGPTTQRIAANTTAGAPSMTNANDATWNAVAATGIDISSTFSPKLPSPTEQAIPDSIYFKAIVNAGRLYLRIEYTDDSLNLLKDFYSVYDSNLNFTKNTYSQEDQIYVLFETVANSNYDVWSWRSLTTAPARLAEGRTYDKANDSPVVDIGGQVVATTNTFSSSRPVFVHQNGPSYTGQILYIQDTVHLSPTYSNPNHWPIGTIVPAYLIDTGTGHRVRDTAAYFQSRWDINAVHSYNPTTNRLVVVMSRLLNTTYPDDAVLADSAKVKIGVFDDQWIFMTQGSRRGFSQEFWLIL